MTEDNSKVNVVVLLAMVRKICGKITLDLSYLCSWETISSICEGVITLAQPAVRVRHIHRRRIKTEEKAKVVVVAWGTELIKVLAALDILHQDNLKNSSNCTRPM